MPDLDEFPTDIDVSSELSMIQEASAFDSTVSVLHFTFCLLFAERPWQTIPLDAPSAEAAALTMNQLAARLNVIAKQLGYPPNVISWRSGECG